MNLLIKSQSATPENPEENANSEDGAAPGSAAGAENAPIDPDLELIIHKWTDLPQTLKAGILAMVRAAE